MRHVVYASRSFAYQTEFGFHNIAYGSGTNDMHSVAALQV
jgi:hypothetical protein